MPVEALVKLLYLLEAPMLSCPSDGGLMTPRPRQTTTVYEQQMPDHNEAYIWGSPNQPINVYHS